MTSVDDQLGDLPPQPPPPHGRRDRARRRRVAAVVLALVVVPLGVLAVAAVWFWWQLDPPGAAGEQVEVRIEHGWRVGRIADELADRDVIGSSAVFQLYARLTGKDDIQAGTYDLRRRMGVRDALSTLADGPRIDYVDLAVPPGLWLVEIAERVGQVPGRDAETFLTHARNGSARSKYLPAGAPPNLEGLLWPDTYRISESEDEIAILTEMVRLFDARADALGLESAATQGRTPYEIITIASLIEAESRVADERPLVASVIYNRLRDGMPLQIDATLLYARGEPANRRIGQVDKDRESPYNTYLYAGLPPTPIGSVTESSLRAAAAPADTDFLFYVIADAEGRHVFARTYEEHLRNIEAARAAGVL